ncbi:MAG: MoxR family ATPase, partial [Porticoccaceae bacterium]
MATQNPIEQEGTYPLPEAQLDRFLLHVLVDYPDAAAERRILALARDEAAGTTGAPFAPLAQDVIFAARRATLAVHMDPAVEEYLVQLILATRNTKGYGTNLKNWIHYGASPRATIALDRCARVMAWLDDRDYVTPDDIRDIAPDVLRHRILLNFEAEAEGVTTSQAIAQLLAAVPSA